MKFTAGRRFVFAASRRYARPEWPPEENERVYGAGGEGAWGSGENYVAHLFLSGTPDPETGMIANISVLGEQIRESIEPRYDHRFLNVDTPPFDTLAPTPERIARRLLEEARAHVTGAVVSGCHLAESPATGAITTADGRTEREYILHFSAARRTFSPHLSEAENTAFFGRAASPLGHGHSYRLRVVLAGPVDERTGVIVPHGTITPALAALHAELDHRNLNEEFTAMRGGPMTTECLARTIHARLSRELPVARVRLNETGEIFAEYDGSKASLGVVCTFSAAHRLNNPAFTEEENRRIFGKCARPNGHGHRYSVEATVSGGIDERTGAVTDLGRLDETLRAAIAPLDRHHLDKEVPDFRGIRSSSENVLRVLWDRLVPAFPAMAAAAEPPRLTRLRLQETENNRFALRAD